LGSSTEGFGDPMTYTSTPKSMEEVAIEVMKTYKVAKLFYIIAIVSLNMGNVTLKVNYLMKKLVTREKEKAVSQEELDKEKEFQKGYKHNMEI
jgi:hypothetical protein